MTKVNKKGGSEIRQKIIVGVITVRPFECVVNSAHTLMQHGELLPLKRRFRFPGKLPDHVKDVILWKISADKGGGSWKMIMNPINVESPQSLNHVQPVCEFTANDLRENLSAAIFHEGSPCKTNIEDIIHRCCMLVQIEVGETYKLQ